MTISRINITPPYYIVSFTSLKTDINTGYATMAEEMEKLAREQPGYLGHDGARGADGIGITNSYWKTKEDVINWKKVSQHIGAQKLGQQRWYQYYTVRVGKIERAYDFGFDE